MPTATVAARTTTMIRRRNMLLGPETLGVLLLVVAAVVARFDRRPPGAVLPVPVDRRAEAGLAERVLRRPAERPQLRVVERVAAVGACAVLDVAAERRVGAGQLEDPVRHLEGRQSVGEGR